MSILLADYRASPGQSQTQVQDAVVEASAEAQSVALCGEFCEFVFPSTPTPTPAPAPTPRPPFHEALKLVDTAAHLNAESF